MSTSRSGRPATLLILVCWPVLAPGQPTGPRDFMHCDGIVDDAARLQCYDEVSRQRKASSDEPKSSGVAVAAEDDAREEPADPPQPEFGPDEGEVDQVPDNLGLSSVRGGDQRNREIFHARLVDCRPGGTGKTFFYFDNGQVWRQADERRVDFGNCDFDVTISKDMFGYRIEPDGNMRGVRISRVR